MTAETLDTLPKLLKHNYEKYGDRKVAMRVKDFGIWQEYTWKDYYEKAKYFSLGLISLGLKPGDKVGVLGENKPEWYWAELGVQAAGAVATGIFTDCIPDEVKYFLEDSESTFIVCHDQEQVDKALTIKDELPLLKKVIYWDPKGLWSYDDPMLMGFDEVIEEGKNYDQAHPGLFDRNAVQGTGEDVSLLCYTSGTTGLPKGAVISYNTLIGTTARIAVREEVDDGWEYVSYLPPAWVAEQEFGVAMGLITGMIVNFPEEPETVQEDLREIGATILFWGPRQWESVTRTIQAKITDTNWLNRLLYNLFLPVALRKANLQFSAKEPGLFWKVLYSVGYRTSYRELRDKFGLSRIKVAISSGGAVGPDIIRYFQGIGVDVRQGYGLSEFPVISWPDRKQIKPETSGPVDWQIEVRIAEDGEIMAGGKDLFSGYYKRPEASEERMAGRWFLTGDFGHIDDEGQLIIMDRMDDLRPLAGGLKFSPQYTEIRLRFSPYIKDCAVVGGGDKGYVTAVINIDYGNVGRWAEIRHIPYTTYTDLSQKPEVVELIEKDIGRVNRLLPEYCRIKKFANLHKEFDADEAELTRTRKLRRIFVEERYAELINALYSDEPEFVVESPIVYRDGRKGAIRHAIKITGISGERH